MTTTHPRTNQRKRPSPSRAALLVVLPTSLALASCVLGSCVLAAPRTEHPVLAESRLVMVIGDRADALGWTMSSPEGGMLRVRMHDGRELVVREQATAAPWLEAGRWVLRRTASGLEPAEILSGMDAFLEVRPRGGAAVIVPIAEVVGILHEAPAVPPTPPPPPVEPPRGRMSELVELGETPDVRAGRALGCANGTVHVLLGSGRELDVPEAAVRDLRVIVGQPVTAFWEGTSYPAHVVAVRGREARIDWDDDSDTPEQWVQLSMLDRIVGPLGTGAVIAACRSSGPVAVEIGRRVRVGRLVSCEAGVRVVSTQDGVERLVEPMPAIRARVGIGDRVEALWNHDTPYAAQILSIGERVHVRWEDASETDVDPADLVSYVRTEDRPGEPVVCPAPATSRIQ